MRALAAILSLSMLLLAPAASDAGGARGQRGAKNKPAQKARAKKGSARSTTRPRRNKAGQGKAKAASHLGRQKKQGPSVYRPKNPMTIGMVGLGKMGGNMTERLLLGGHGVVAFDSTAKARREAAKKGATEARSVDALVKKLPEGQRVVWVMVPAGEVTDKVINELASKLGKGDIVIDGGNSNYKDTARRAAKLKKRGIHLVDVGTSGGVWGLERGYSLMIGGPQRVVKKLNPLFQTLAPGPRKGWGRVGNTGAGHRAKMIHNGIEYAMMRALAEGLMLGNTGDLKMNPAELSRIWKDGSVISSWLVDLTAEGLKKNPDLKKLSTVIPDSGEGRWTVIDGVEHGVPLPVISQALINRLSSQVADKALANKLEQVMRAGFGGHEPVTNDKAAE